MGLVLVFRLMQTNCPEGFQGDAAARVARHG